MGRLTRAFPESHRLFVQRIFFAERGDAGSGFFFCFFILRMGQNHSDDIADLAHILFLETACRKRRRSETDAARDERGQRFKRDGVAVGRDVYFVQNVLRLFAGDAFARQIDQHQMIVRAAGDDAESVRHQRFRQYGRILLHLLCVRFKLRTQSLAQRNGLGRNDMHQRAALDAGEYRLVELLAELREMGVGVYATGGETADVGDLVRTIIVDSTVTCRMKRSDVIDNANIRPGDVIVGLASYGKATYEKEYNGGMGSNGLTSARHDVFSKYLAEKYPESYDKAVPEELVYSGKLKLTDSVEDSPLDAGKLVLSPTRTYAPVVKKLLDALRPQIHGMVHCSGGAQTKVLHFVGDNCRVIKDNLFPVPPLFKTVKEQSDTDWSEMYKVFNMGHRLEVYLSPEHAEEVIAISKSFNIDAQIVGRVEESDKKELIIKSEFGEFKY